jgi:DNA-directed RNA polymerase subunit RPC12/RpoP
MMINEIYVCDFCGRLAPTLEIENAKFDMVCPTMDCGMKLSDYRLTTLSKLNEVREEKR